MNINEFLPYKKRLSTILNRLMINHFLSNYLFKNNLFQYINYEKAIINFYSKAKLLKDQNKRINFVYDL